MQRYMLTDYASASTETRAVYDDFMKTTGATAVPVWLQSLGHNAALARTHGEYLARLWRIRFMSARQRTDADRVLADPHSAPWRRRLAQGVAGFMEGFMK